MIWRSSWRTWDSVGLVLIDWVSCACDLPRGYGVAERKKKRRRIRYLNQNRRKSELEEGESRSADAWLCCGSWR